jgi:hypothetical protein
MAGVHATIFRDIVSRGEPQVLVSLSLQAVPTGQAITLPDPLTDGLEIVKDYIAWPCYTACHNVAGQLNETLGVVGNPNVATDAAGITLAKQSLNGNNVIWLQYAQHSITLIAYNGTVESIEAWAGSPPGTPGRVIVLPFHECIFERLDEINVSVQEARDALDNVKHQDKQTRSAAWDVISRAGGADAFEKGTSSRILTVTVRPLDAVLRIHSRINSAELRARRWLLRYSHEIFGRPYCCGCWNQHGNWKSSYFGRWHWCNNCKKSYCSACGAGMQRPADKPNARTRRCVPCNGETELIE